MCHKCKGFSERLRLGNPREYLDLVRQLDELVKTEVFRLVQGISTLAEILEGQQWPDDVIAHVFECPNCGQRFQLSVDTYHGAGGAWEMMVSEGSSNIQ